MPRPKNSSRGAVAAPVSARPFLKWAGGKRQLVPAILDVAPASYGTYHEPFVGGGAVFFALDPRRAVLYDSNLRLVRTWKAIRDDVESVVGLLGGYPHERDFFLELRAREIDAGTDVEVAAWLIYLNKTAFNGLYRVNASNRFNVPFGRYTHPLICDATLLRACSERLRRAEIVHGDFSLVEKKARKGDLVYFDPPYDPLSSTSNFTAYSGVGFGSGDQARLRDVALGLKGRGVSVVISNSATPRVRALYSGAFAVREVMASRAINSRTDRRGKIAELLMF